MGRELEFVRACKSNNLHLAQFLLLEGQVNPAAWNNAALCAAVERNHSAIVQLLMQNEQVRAQLLTARRLTQTSEGTCAVCLEIGSMLLLMGLAFWVLYHFGN